MSNEENPFQLLEPGTYRQKSNISGKRFGQLIAKRAVGKKYTSILWECICDCGNKFIARQDQLKNGNTISCGCSRKKSRKHGMTKSKEYRAWADMKKRCLDKTHPAYYLYGKRGISICKKWVNSFESFFEDMGKKPEGHSIDRINNNGNYEPKNCKWSTPKEQANNRRNNRKNHV